MRLPTPSTVAAVLGGDFAVPERDHAVAAIVLQVDGVRRQTWSADVELPVPLFASFAREVPAPDTNPTPGPAASFKVLDGSAPSEERRCSTCVIRPGESPCVLCGGSGCVGCGGSGFVRCHACDGSTRVVACTVQYVNDAPVHIRRALVPAMDASLRPYVEAKLDPRGAWSVEHAFDPAPTLLGSAYRGAGAARAGSEDFQGFLFGDALAACLVAREEATTGLARFVVRTYAIPILWTVQGSHHRAFFFDPSNELQVVASF